MNKNPIRFGFFGTPHFAVLILEELKHAGFTPSFVVTNPDRPKGRTLKITEPEVKVWAKRENVKVFQPENIDHAFIEKMREERVDVFIVAAYGKILPKELIYLPPRRSLNVHPSLLPKYRGATPIESVILADEQNTGVTIICIDEKMDHGPIVATEQVHIAHWPITAPTLEKELAHKGGQLLCRILPDWIFKKITAKPQHDADATYTKKITKEDGEIDPNGDGRVNYLKFLAYNPWPGIYFFVNHHGKKVRVIVKKATFVDGVFEIESVLPEGKNEMLYEVFTRSLVS